MIRAQLPPITAPSAPPLHAPSRQAAGRSPSPALPSRTQPSATAAREAPLRCAPNFHVPPCAGSTSDRSGAQQMWRPARRELLNVGLAAATAGAPPTQHSPSHHRVKSRPYNLFTVNSALKSSRAGARSQLPWRPARRELLKCGPCRSNSRLPLRSVGREIPSWGSLGPQEIGHGR